MLDREKLAEAAKIAFERSIKDKIRFLSVQCWPENLKGILPDLNKIICAARQLEVTEATPLPDEELNTMAEDLKPLRILNMVEEAREYIINTISKYGISTTIFTAEMGKKDS